MTDYVEPEDRTFVLAVDPGGANGLALVRRDTLEKVESLEAPWPDACRWIATVFTDHGPNVDVVVERFIITPATGKHSAGSAALAIEVIGMVRLMCLQYKVLADPDTLTLYTSAEAKSFMTSQKLRELGWWHRGGKGHANMALSHVGVRLLRTGCRDPRLLGL